MDEYRIILNQTHSKKRDMYFPLYVSKKRFEEWKEMAEIDENKMECVDFEKW